MGRIREQQRALREKIAEYHLKHGETREKTAAIFGVSEYLVTKSVAEKTSLVGSEHYAATTSLRFIHISKCILAILAIADKRESESGYNRLVLDGLSKAIVAYKDSLESGGKVRPDFFRSPVFQS